MEGTLQHETASTSNEALRKALEALQAGRHDGRLPDGAQANALESIAWSLIGILSHQVATETSTGGRSMSEELQRRGFLKLDPQ